ncbi:hypothetical protein G6F59_017806 [Rhizopus arrhizus]|nr:hypothetical protein G6F59_017806 [Rhizopus arrhizus]
MAHAPLRHGGRQQVHGGRDAADAHRGGLRIQQALQVVRALGVGIEQPFDLGAGGKPRGGQAHVVGAALEQRHAHQRFQFTDGG